MALMAAKGIVKPQCTSEYKLTPIETELRKLLGLGYREATPPGMFVELWIGISRDEVIRIKHSRQSWIEDYWPLLELGMTRADCQE